VIFAVAGAISTVLFVSVGAGFSAAGAVFAADGMMALKASYCYYSAGIAASSR
jgi:amino acid permease